MAEINEPMSSTPLQPLPPHIVSLRQLYADRGRYNVSPPFQREDAWPTRVKQALIDTILTGDPVMPLEGYQEYGEDGELTYTILDGHQRLTTILDFMDCTFKTWTAGQKRLAEPNSAPPVEPNMFFNALSPVARHHFQSYSLQINLIREISEERVITRFLRVQNHKPLTAAERLNAYRSKAKDVARLVELHDFWGNFYDGKTDRKQLFQCSLYLLAIELAKPNIALDLQATDFFHQLVIGKRDKEVKDTIADDILARLDVVTHLYSGMEPFRRRAAVIPMYQSAILLEQTGYTIQQTDKGRLASWMHEAIMQSSRGTGVPNWVVPIQKLVYKRAQEEFWRKQYDAMLKRFGIQRPAA